MPTDLTIAVANLTAKKARYDTLWKYYDGDQPLRYSSEKLKEIFHGLTARFTANWCAVVVDSVLDRLELRDLVVSDDDAATAALRTMRERSGLIDDEGTIHESLCVTGEAFVIVWPDEESGAVQAFVNDARLCHAEYDAANPRRLRMAAKWWQEADAVRLNLYYADRIEYYSTEAALKDGEMPSDKAFVPLGDDPVVTNEYGVIPVFHFRSNSRRAVSQLDSVLPLQDLVNKLISDLTISAEFSASKLRWVISQVGLPPNSLQAYPNSVWDLPAADKDSQPTQVGEFTATDLMNFLNPINKFAADIGVITRTPRHYFYAQGGDPSGEALIAMEAPLNRKVTRLQAALSPTWRDLAAFLLLLGGAQVPSQRIWANYEPPQTVQPMTAAIITKTLVEAGRPLANVLRDDGWSDADLQEMADDARAERVANASYADAVLTQAQTMFDRGEAV